MIIRKFLHSCILIEESGSRLLIDPGEFSFIEGRLKPEDFPQIHTLLLTHEHSDHFFPEALKTIIAAGRPHCITHARLAELLRAEGIKSEILGVQGKTISGPFTIEGVEAPHGALPITPPPNMGFLINDAILHPGDSLKFSIERPLEILLLPIVAPWLTLKEAVETAIRMRPKIVIPIHDAIIKDFMLTRMHRMCEKALGEAGIAFRPLALGEEFTT